MEPFRTNCYVRNDCKYKDSLVCNSCTRNQIQRSDRFEQDSEVVKTRFTETIKSRFNKVQ